MMIVKKRKVANPQKTKPRKKKMTPKQIKHFGTKRQKAALKAKRSRAVPKKTARNPKRAVRRNPVHLITLGLAGNPHKPKRKTKKRNPNMATLTKKQKRVRAGKKAARTRKRNLVANTKMRHKNPHRSSAAPKRRKRKNATRIVVMSPRRRKSNPHASRQRVTHRRRYARNPELFGHNITSAGMAKQILGGLIGVAITKTVPAYLPAQATSTPILATVTSIVTALAAGFIAKKVMPDIASAVTFGGLMQAGSMILNQYLPSVGNVIGLSGLGNLIGPASFSVPQNPLRPGNLLAMPSAGGTRIGVSGLTRSFGHAF